MKKFVSLILTFIMLLSMGITAFAADTITDKVTIATPMADELKKMGLFYGTDKGYELERAGTRAEALVMLIRLLGEEETAKKSNYTHPFTDVPKWAVKYVGYGYHKGYSYGVSTTKFGSEDKTSAAQYITFVLRALGYSEKADGYTWNNPFAFAEKIGLIKRNEYSAKSTFLRADIVIVSYRALDIKYKGKDVTLREKLSGTTEPGSGDAREAGNFRTANSDLVIVNKKADYDTNLGNLNQMLFDTYGLTYIPELSKNGLSGSTAKFLYDESTGRYGLRISSWRQSYDSGIVVNNVLNAILESFYFFSGDKDVAVSLWKWFDAKNINGYSNTTDFGFKDIAEVKNGGTISKNGVEIDITEVKGITTVYFK